MPSRPWLLVALAVVASVHLPLADARKVGSGSSRSSSTSTAKKRKRATGTSSSKTKSNVLAVDNPPPELQTPGTIWPRAVSASHALKGFGPRHATDGLSHTFWLVPGGQRMEMMSRDKWLVLDLGSERPVHGLSLRGLVESFAPARVRLEVGETADGPWEHVHAFRALGAPLRWQRVDLRAEQRPEAARFLRLYVRREGHATFKHALHGVLVHCEPTEEELKEAEKQAKKKKKK